VRFASQAWRSDTNPDIRASRWYASGRYNWYSLKERMHATKTQAADEGRLF